MLTIQEQKGVERAPEPKKTAFSPGVVGLEAAGGRVETLTGAPLTYGKPGFKNDGFIAWGRRPAG